MSFARARNSLTWALMSLVAALIAHRLRRDGRRRRFVVVVVVGAAVRMMSAALYPTGWPELQPAASGAEWQKRQRRQQVAAAATGF